MVVVEEKRLGIAFRELREKREARMLAGWGSVNDVICVLVPMEE